MSDEKTNEQPKAPQAVASTDLLDEQSGFDEWWKQSVARLGGNKEAAKEAWEFALQRAWAVVNSAIQRGELSGNGSDLTAQRNGQIIAANQIAEFIRTSNATVTGSKQPEKEREL